MLPRSTPSSLTAAHAGAPPSGRASRPPRRCSRSRCRSTRPERPYGSARTGRGRLHHRPSKVTCARGWPAGAPMPGAAPWRRGDLRRWVRHHRPGGGAGQQLDAAAPGREHRRGVRRGTPVRAQPEGTCLERQGPGTGLRVAAPADVSGADEDEAEHTGGIEALQLQSDAEPVEPGRRLVADPRLLAPVLLRHAPRPHRHCARHAGASWSAGCYRKGTWRPGCQPSRSRAPARTAGAPYVGAARGQPPLRRQLPCQHRVRLDLHRPDVRRGRERPRQGRHPHAGGLSAARRPAGLAGRERGGARGRRPVARLPRSIRVAVDLVRREHVRAVWLIDHPGVLAGVRRAPRRRGAPGGGARPQLGSPVGAPGRPRTREAPRDPAPLGGGGRGGGGERLRR